MLKAKTILIARWSGIREAIATNLAKENNGSIVLLIRTKLK
jgi:hypothetical protein